MCTGKVGQSSVGETEWYKRLTAGAFALCAKRLVKFILGVNVNNILQEAFLPVDLC